MLTFKTVLTILFIFCVRETLTDNGGKLLQPIKFDFATIKEVVKLHNDLRSSINASDMNQMLWDTNLATLAQDRAEKCDPGHHRPHSQRRNIGEFSFVGENSYAHSNKNLSQIEPIHMKEFWWEQINDFVYGPMGEASCSDKKDCLHFSQMVWSKSCAIGCGAAICDKIVDFNEDLGGHIVICNYGPGGNNRESYPYALGVKCSSCDNGCLSQQNLCKSECSLAQESSSDMRTILPMTFDVPKPPDVSDGGLKGNLLKKLAAYKKSGAPGYKLHPNIPSAPSSK